MSLTYLQARDEILSVIEAAWDPTGHPMAWPDVDSALPPSTMVPWARTTLSHSTGEAASLTGGTGKRRFRRDGFVTVQVFTPRGDGLSTAYPLANTLADALEGLSTDGGVWFRNVRVNETGPDEVWQQINVVADFTYDEVK